MTRLAGKTERPDEVSWTLQIQYKATGPWCDHTGRLFDVDEAHGQLAECRAAYPHNRYRLVRVTTSYVIEVEPDRTP